MNDKKLPEACKICLKLQPDSEEFTTRPLFNRNGGKFNPCSEMDESSCLPKDRAMIVLLDKLLKK